MKQPPAYTDHIYDSRQMEPTTTEKVLYPPYGDMDSGTTREIAESIMQLQASQAERNSPPAEGGGVPARRQTTWNMFGAGRKSEQARGSVAAGTTTFLLRSCLVNGSCTLSHTRYFSNL